LGYKELSSKSYRQGLGGDRLKKEGGGVGYVHNQNRDKYTRILDPVHVLSARGKARGGEREDDGTYKRPIKKYLIAFRTI
jgi:hypothetical protein